MTVAIALLPSAVAVIRAVPTVRPVTTFEALTVATVVSELEIVSDRPGSTFPALSRASTDS
ncbi:MAG: hypothetical protein M3P24_12010 [Gemmatimonadota bacterium]|nr:hypothetical protein [Gemmatimonadota bacterium]